MATTGLPRILDNAATQMDAKALDHAISMSNSCMYLACACVVGAAVSMLIMAFAKTPKNAADTALETAKNLSGHPNLAPVSVDIPKVIDAAKGVIDSLTKASPLLVWMSAAVFFMGIGMFGVSNYAQQHPDRDVCFETEAEGASAAAPKPNTIKCIKKAETDQKQENANSGGTTTGAAAGSTHSEQSGAQAPPPGARKP